MGSEIAVSPFDVRGEGFSDDMFFGRQHFLIGFEIVGAEKADVQVFDFLEQSLAGALVAFADVKSQDFTFIWSKSIPTPSFLSLSFVHERPKLVDLNFFKRTFKLRFRYAAHGPAQFVKHGAGVEVQHFGDVTDAASPKRHFEGDFLNARMGAPVRIAVLKLFPAVFAKIILLSVGFFAVLLDVCSLAVGTLDLDEYFEHTSKVV